MGRIMVTGGAGFIGSHLCEKLLELGDEVVCVDNFSLGNEGNIAGLSKNPAFTLCKADAADTDKMTYLMKRSETEYVYHLAANSDIQKSASDPAIEFDNTFSTTYGVLEAMRRNGVKGLFFASTSAVYGEKPNRELREDTGGLMPVSYYGGAKLASEAYLSSYAHMNGMDVTIFRFPNVIGPHLTHGVIFDFVTKLRKDPKTLEILGDGTQNKPYLYVMDLIAAILKISKSGDCGLHVYNIGVDSSTSVREIADMVCGRMGLAGVEYRFTGGDRGWKGDVPSFRYDLTRIHEKGWRAAHSSKEAVMETLNHLEL